MKERIRREGERREEGKEGGVRVNEREDQEGGGKEGGGEGGRSEGE